MAPRANKSRLRRVALLPHAAGLRCARPTSCLLSLGAHAAARACAPSFSKSSTSLLCHTCGALCFLSFWLRARLLRIYVASLPHAVGLRCARPTLVRAAALHILSFFHPPLPLPLSFARPRVNAKIFARPRVNARARAYSTFRNMRLSATVFDFSLAGKNERSTSWNAKRRSFVARHMGDSLSRGVLAAALQLHSCKKFFMRQSKPMLRCLRDLKQSSRGIEKQWQPSRRAKV